MRLARFNFRQTKAAFLAASALMLATGSTVAMGDSRAPNANSTASSTGQAQSRGDHFAALKTALALTSRQDAAWTALLAAQDARMTASRTAADTALAHVANMSLPERLDVEIILHARQHADLAAFAVNLKTFYASLTAMQQDIMDAAFPMGPRH